MRTVTINYNGEEMTIDGTLERSGDGLVTPFTSDFEIETVYYKGEDVTDLLDVLNVDWSDIERKCLDEIDGVYTP